MAAQVTLKISAESAEALRRVKEFTKGIEGAWSSVRAGDPAIHGSIPHSTGHRSS